MTQRQLYPRLEPFDRFELSVGDGHVLYAEQSGARDGVPVIFLHGGPGAGAMRVHARFYDPARYRIVLFDQRGVGKSSPSATGDAGLRANTTWHLVEDIVALADHLGWEQFVLAGGSWGSTLALALAMRHPERLRALVLRGVMTFRQRELDWYFRDGASRLFPDAHASFLAPLWPEEHADPPRGYRRLLLGTDSGARDRAARAWRAWAAVLGSLRPVEVVPRETGGDPPAVSVHALANARLECLYSDERAFLPEDDTLLAAAPSLAHVPLHIVQGRYDLTCPAETAHALHQAWPGSTLQLTHAGHSMFETANVDALIRVHDALAGR